MPTTLSSGLRYPAASAAPNVPQDIQNLATDLDNKVVPSFTTIAARNAAITAPTLGQLCTVAGGIHRWDGAAWHWENRGYFVGTTDAGGFLVVPHSLGAAPGSGVQLTSGSQNTDLLARVLTLSVSSWDSSNFTVYAHRSDTSAALGTNSIQFSWTASV